MRVTRGLGVVLTSGKFLEVLGSGIGAGLVFCHSFSVSNNVFRVCMPDYGQAVAQSKTLYQICIVLYVSPLYFPSKFKP